MIVHELGGCAPMPLAHYLKALGILRLISEQKDPDARAWWEGERFFIASQLDSQELERFLLEEYRPTPLLSPWNGASGFFRTWDAKKKKLRNSKNLEALETLSQQTGNRWNDFRDAYQNSIKVLAANLRQVNVDALPAKERGRLLIVPEGCGPEFPVADKDNDKGAIQVMMQRRMAANPFYRSAIVDTSEEIAYPSLWGSGGNDGAIDFSARYYENLVETCVKNEGSKSPNWLRAALFATSACGLLTGSAGKVGQFLPGGAGGANSVNGPGDQDDTLLNPWDFVLMLEGAVLFTANTSRRLGPKTSARLAAPFSVSAHSAGYSSASDSDESACGEQWMPLWSQPLTLPELKRLLSEGRAQIGGHGAQEPLDLARAVARLGTARGITAFQRYGYIERNGQSNLAVPLGRISVPDHSESRIAPLDDLEAWLPRLRLQARDTKTRKAPASLKQAEKRLANDLFSVIQRPDEPLRWQAILEAMTEVEAILRTGAGMRAGPVPTLRPEWVSAADDGSPEFRLALAFALQAAAFSREGHPFDPVRRHWLPLDGSRFATSGTGSQQRLRIGPDVVMQGRDAEADAVALVERRLVEGSQRGQRRLPLQSAPRTAAEPHDLALLISGRVDLQRSLDRGLALMALDSSAWFVSDVRPRPAPRDEWPDDAWIAIRLAMLPWPLDDGRRIGTDPAILRRLASGDATNAVQLALRRLRAAGIHVALRGGSADPGTARRWAAALAFPVNRKTAFQLLNRIELKKQENRT